jgi:hypothetical protein
MKEQQGKLAINVTAPKGSKLPYQLSLYSMLHFPHEYHQSIQSDSSRHSQMSFQLHSNDIWRFMVLVMKSAIFCNVTLYNVEDPYRSFGGSSVEFYHSTRGHIPENNIHGNWKLIVDNGFEMCQPLIC